MIAQKSMYSVNKCLLNIYSVPIGGIQQFLKSKIYFARSLSKFPIGELNIAKIKLSRYCFMYSSDDLVLITIR